MLHPEPPLSNEPAPPPGAPLSAPALLKEPDPEILDEPTPELLNEMELDALTELMNIAVSRAAASLRTLVGSEVLLSVPSVAVISRGEAARTIGDGGPSRLVAVRQTFEGELHGSAMLIFPETNSLEVVRAVAGGGMSAEDIVALEHEALAETGNIFLNSCLATIANILGRGLRMSLPEILRGSGTDLFRPAAGSDPENIALLIYFNFSFNDHEINGYIAMIMDLPALQALKALLHGLILRVTGAASSLNHVVP
jgi:chemotaxis protein CheC